MTINSNNITDFIRPNRLIWQDAPEYGSSNIDADSDVDSYVKEEVSEENPEEEGITLTELKNSIEEGIKVNNFYNEAQRANEIAVKRGVDNLYGRICSYKEGDDISKIKRFKEFIDEIGKKILNVDPDYKNVKDTMRRFRVIEKMCDMERLMDCFETSVGYEVRPYKNTDERDAIIFTYGDGSTEIFPLELSANEIINIFIPPLRALARGHDEQMRRNDEMEKKKEEEEFEDLIENARFMDTPDKAYGKLLELTSALPQDFLDRICDPISALGDVIGNADIVDGNIKISTEDMKEAENAIQDLKDAFVDYYGENYRDNMSLEEREDLMNISKVFFLEGFLDKNI